jgi:hypothetical protein
MGAGPQPGRATPHTADESIAAQIREARPTTVCVDSIPRPTDIFVARFSENPKAIINCGARSCNQRFSRSSAGCVLQDFPPNGRQLSGGLLDRETACHAVSCHSCQLYGLSTVLV